MSQDVFALDGRGYLDVRKLDGLDPDTLHAWVTGRLAGEDPFVPIHEQVGERPESLLAWAHGQADPASDFRTRLDQLAERLLHELLGGSGPVAPWAEAFLRLLQKTVIRRLHPLFLAAFQRELFRQGRFREGGLDRQLLSAIRANRVGLPEHWDPLLHDARYCDIAYAACSQSPDHAVRALPVYFQTLGPADRELHIGVALSALVRDDDQRKVYDKLREGILEGDLQDCLDAAADARGWDAVFGTDISGAHRLALAGAACER